MESHQQIYGIQRKPWTVEFTAEFIELYKNLPSLWKIRCLDYGNRPKKAIAYRQLVNLVKTVDETADTDFVKSKINTLRSCFRKELQKVRNSKRPDAKESPRVTKLWYFDKMMFLIEQEPGPKSRSRNQDGGEETDMQEITQSPTIEVPIIEPDIGTAPKSTNCGSLLNGNRSSGSSRQKTASYSSRNCGTVMLQEAAEKMASADGIEAFVTFVTAKLRSMDNVQRLFAERLITDVLYRGLFQQLSPRTEIVDRTEICDSSNNDASTSPNINQTAEIEIEPEIASSPTIEISTLPL